MKKFNFPLPNHRLKGVLAVMLVILLTLSSTFVGVAATEAETPAKTVYTQGFEGTYTLGSNNARGSNAITEEKARTGNKSLKYELTTNDYAGEQATRLKDSSDQNIAVHTGDKVILSFYYLYETAITSHSSIGFYVFYNNGNNGKGDTNWKKSTQINTAQVSTEWQKAEIEITVEETYNNLYLALGFWRPKFSSGTYYTYVDDVQIDIVPAGNSYVKLDNYDNNGNYEILAGTVGETVTLPRSVVDGYACTSWTDAEGTAYTEVTLTDTALTLTPTWVKTEYTQDFEDVTYTPEQFQGRGTVSVTTEKFHTGNGSLKFDINKSTNTSAGDTGARLKDSDGQNITVHTGDKVVVSFYYLYETAFSNATIYCCFNNGTWDAAADFTGKINISAKASSEWQKATVETTVPETSNGYVLSLDVWRNGADPRKGVIYFDDLHVDIVPDGNSYVKLDNYDANGGYKVLQAVTGDAVTLPTPAAVEGYVFAGWKNGDAAYDDPTVTLDGNTTTLTAQWTKISVELKDYNADGSSEVLSGEYNTTAELPTPERDGYVFIGWKNGDEDYTSKTVTFNGEVTALTAQWFKTKYTQDFENDFTVQSYGGRGSISVTDEKFCTGTKSLKYSITNGNPVAGDTVAKLKDSDNKDITVHTGDKVVLSFRYLYETSFNSATFKYGFNDGKGVASTNFKGLTTISTKVSSEWQTATVEITVKETYDNCVLSLDVWRSGTGTGVGVIYVDDIQVDIIPGVTLLTLNNIDANGKSETTTHNVYDVITLPTPEAVDGYEFLGWTDAEGTAYTEVTIDGKTAYILTAQWKLIGDLNGDGVLTADDLATLRTMLLSDDTSNNDADLNGDTNIDICDLVSLYHRVPK